MIGVNYFSVWKPCHKVRFKIKQSMLINYMSYSTNISKARVNAGGFYIVKDAFSKLNPGNVKIILGSSSATVLMGKVTSYAGPP